MEADQPTNSDICNHLSSTISRQYFDDIKVCYIRYPVRCQRSATAHFSMDFSCVCIRCSSILHCVLRSVCLIYITISCTKAHRFPWFVVLGNSLYLKVAIIPYIMLCLTLIFFLDRNSPTNNFRYLLTRNKYYYQKIMFQISWK